MRFNLSSIAIIDKPENDVAKNIKIELGRSSLEDSGCINETRITSEVCAYSIKNHVDTDFLWCDLQEAAQDQLVQLLSLANNHRRIEQRIDRQRCVYSLCSND